MAQLTPFVITSAQEHCLYVLKTENTPLKKCGLLKYCKNENIVPADLTTDDFFRHIMHGLIVHRKIRIAAFERDKEGYDVPVYVVNNLLPCAA